MENIQTRVIYIFNETTTFSPVVQCCPMELNMFKIYIYPFA